MPMTKEKPKGHNVMLRPETYKKLRRAAEREERSLTNTLNRIIDASLAKPSQSGLPASPACPASAAPLGEPGDTPTGSRYPEEGPPPDPYRGVPNVSNGTGD